MDQHLIFLSYNHQDSEFADRLAADLRERGITVWRDRQNLFVGDYMIDRITKAVESCMLLVALVSVRYVSSKWCRHEIRLKLSGEVTNGNIRVLPVRLDETDPEAIVPAKGWADFRDSSRYEIAFGNLLMSISYHLDPARADEKRQALEAMLKQSYVDACYGTLSATDALDQFQAAATMNPDSLFVWRALGYIYHLHQADFETAEKYYRRALSIDPDNAPVNRALGIMYMHAGRIDSARQFLQRAQELGYKTAMEWREYSAAGVQYNMGPHSIGGIPILFGSVGGSADKLLDGDRHESSEKDKDRDGG